MRLWRIAPAGLLSSLGDWSPQGNEIVFSQHVTPDARSSIWVVHSDGSGLHEIAVQAQPGRQPPGLGHVSRDGIAPTRRFSCGPCGMGVSCRPVGPAD